MKTDPVARIDAKGALVPLGDPGARRFALLEGERLHRLFRPDMGGDYAALMTEIASAGGGVVQLHDGDAVRSLAVWRMFRTTYCGLRFEIDDLVTDPECRSQGHGATLLDWLEEKALGLGCNTVTLNSATVRLDAHRFYFRQRYEILGFHFSKSTKYKPSK
ncbi:GNAT family N-acetyltransferase [Brevundimonas sp.]|uniref:GNAT family N-acetyltransferase n=1 Tax=Brevundimonas sp. TaxID=1871086 RepID=UPI002E0E0879|nr:GNAT family N-acetyltransferase [Brevundimonas sp.]